MGRRGGGGVRGRGGVRGWGEGDGERVQEVPGEGEQGGEGE